MKIPMIHPKHGEKMAYHLAEVANDKLKGWVEKTAIDPDNKPKKRGRPPKES